MKTVCMFLAVGLMALAAQALLAQPGPDAGAVKVTFTDVAKTETPEIVQGIDPTHRIDVQYVGQMRFGLMVEGRQICCGAGAISVQFKIDNQIQDPQPQQDAQQNLNNTNVLRGGPVPAIPAPGSGPAAAPGDPAAIKKLLQPITTSKWTVNNLHITQTIEPAPGKVSKGSRPLDTVWIKYTIENKDTRPHQVAMRVREDTLCVDNDGALFAAPSTMPGKIIDGEELKGKQVPDDFQMLQQPNLANPGFVAHFTLKPGGKMIGPDRVACTNLGGVGNWETNLMKANGDSAISMVWEPREIPPGTTVVFAYANGGSVATIPENEGRIKLSLGGSFEPGKTFSVTAYVEEPIPSQTLSLHMPAGMHLVEGREIQPVLATAADGEVGVVLWRAQVEKLGEFPIRISSSNGVTQTRTVKISRD